jgi:hypothetical protein
VVSDSTFLGQAAVVPGVIRTINRIMLSLLQSALGLLSEQEKRKKRNSSIANTIVRGGTFFFFCKCVSF